MTDGSVVTLGLILLIACLVAMISRRLRLPYSVGLVTAGIGLAFVPKAVDIELTRELIFYVFLPPLVFEAALQMRWRPFLRALPVTLTLASAGVAIAAACVALGLRVLLGWSWMGAWLFGVLIAATDPVSVIAAFKEMRVAPRLGMMVESESLLNDGTAAVGFGILVGIATGASSGPTLVAISILWTIAGGVACGSAVAAAALLLTGRTEDHLVQITLTTIAAYGSFILADRFGMSGVLASLTAGLIVGNVGYRGALCGDARPHVLAFWQYAAFLANSIVFILIGGHEAHELMSLLTGSAAVVIALVMLGRALSIYPLCLLFRWSAMKVEMPFQHVLVWGGLRGALALALALALPGDLPERRQVITLTFAVVAFSIYAQGLTMPWLIRRLGLTEIAPAPV
jgi:CPA1 family monovalent cation:H+ antiporter